MGKATGQFGIPLDNKEGVDKGQAFSHQLSLSRNWNEGLNALHYILLKKWYYIGIITNTRRNSNKLLSQGVEFSRRREKVDVGLRSILDLKENSYLELKNKIRTQRLKSGKNNDVWHFGSTWKELPAGTNIIELHQSLIRTLLGKKGVRNAFIVLDGKATVGDQNAAMMIINKILTEKEFTERLLEKAKEDSEEPTLTQSPTEVVRNPVTLFKDLMDNFVMVGSSVSVAEKKLLDIYIDELQREGEYGTDEAKTHKQLERSWAKHH